MIRRARGWDTTRTPVDDGIVMAGNAVLIGHRIRVVASRAQFPADDDFVVIPIERPRFAKDISAKRLALFVRHHGAGCDSRAFDRSGNRTRHRIALRKSAYAVINPPKASVTKRTRPSMKISLIRMTRH